MNFQANFFQKTLEIAETLKTCPELEQIVDLLLDVKHKQGRIFFVGSGGGAGHASHATCDFRKLGGFEVYCPTDNVSELTARINDEGLDSSIANCLKAMRICSKDLLFVFSVGGGNEEKNISNNLVQAIKLAKEVGALVTGVVGRDGGYTKQQADACIVVPTVDGELVTPLTESYQAVVWHYLVSHPRIQVQKAKWESTTK